ncbi:MAG: hypothetical protein WBA17_04985 [Saprospiraceae bacterium]
MSTNQLEDFIRDNRPDFDDERPGLGLWQRIEQDLENKQRTTGGGAAGPAPMHTLNQPKRPRKVWLRLAAAVVLLLITGGFLGREIGLRTSAQQREANLLESIAPDYFEMATYYEQEIDRKYATLTNNRAADDQIVEDLAAVDRAMKELREELPDAPREDQARIVSELINSYRIKLDILERILRRLPDADAPFNSTTTPDETPNKSI